VECAKHILPIHEEYLPKKAKYPTVIVALYETKNALSSKGTAKKYETNTSGSAMNAQTCPARI